MQPLESKRQILIDQLTGPDGFFPVEMQDVRGHQVPALINRKRSLRDFVEASAAHGDAEFLVLGDRRITHEGFIDLVAAEAAALSADHEIARGDRVAILAANSPEWVIAYFALVSMGAVVCLYNGWWTPDEIRHATELTSPKVILGDEKRLARVPSGLTVAKVDMIAERDRLQREVGQHQLPNVDIDEDDACSIFFTSGTTGRAKGAVVSHRGLVGFVEVQMLNGALKFMTQTAHNKAAGEPPPERPTTKPRVLMTSPLFHVSGLSGSTLINMNVGGTLVFREGRFDPEECFALIEKERITAWTLIGSMGPRVVDHPRLADHDLSSLTNVGFGGAPASPDLRECAGVPRCARGAARAAPAGLRASSLRRRDRPSPPPWPVVGPGGRFPHPEASNNHLRLTGPPGAGPAPTGAPEPGTQGCLGHPSRLDEANRLMFRRWGASSRRYALAGCLILARGLLPSRRREGRR